MSYLQENISEILSARITGKGREKIAMGNFNISYFQVGDSEFDYNFSEFDGIALPSQRVLQPFDKDNTIKYPYKFSDDEISGTTYGVPVLSSESLTIRNDMGAAGCVGEYIKYNSSNGNGTMVISDWEEVDASSISGGNTIKVPSNDTFYDSDYITVYLGSLGINNVITGSTKTNVYRVVSIATGSTVNTLTLDRNIPNYSTLTGKATIIRNEYRISSGDVVEFDDQQDSWTLNCVWTQNPAGLDPISPLIDERLSGYTSTYMSSTKEFFGYTSSNGQTVNTLTTVTNNFGEEIVVPPEEQHSLAVIHYTIPSSEVVDVSQPFKYEDYIDHTASGISHFEVYIPFIQYDRDNSIIGAKFTMGDGDFYVNSTASDVKTDQIKFRYLMDDLGYKVGRVFVNHNVIVFDDQEIVAVLDYKSNRRYTLPIPKAQPIPINIKCDGYDGTNVDGLLPDSGSTVYVTYKLENTGDGALNGLHSNHYMKVVGSNTISDVSITFNDNDFKYMTVDPDDVDGYSMDKFYVIIQVVDNGEQPDPTQWKKIDMTTSIPNHTNGSVINPTNMRGARFIVSLSDYDTAPLYTLPDPDDIDTSTSPEFGDEQPFLGSVRVSRATDIEVMRFLINLPEGDFTTTQNPTYTDGKSKRITEVSLLDTNKDVLVMAKASSPIVRTGGQVIGVKIDI